MKNDILQTGLRFHPAAPCKDKLCVWRVSGEPSAVTVATGIFLYLPRTPRCALTLEQAFAFAPLSHCFQVALILSDDFKSLGLMLGLSSQNVTPLSASNSLLNPLGISDHWRLQSDKLSSLWHFARGRWMPWKIHHALLGVRKVLLLNIREAGGHSKLQYCSLYKPVLSCHLAFCVPVVSEEPTALSNSSSFSLFAYWGLGTEWFIKCLQSQAIYPFHCILLSLFSLTYKPPYNPEFLL